MFTRSSSSTTLAINVYRQIMCTLNLGICTLSQLSTIIYAYICIQYYSHQGITKLVGRDFVLRLYTHRDVCATSVRPTNRPTRDDSVGGPTSHSDFFYILNSVFFLRFQRPPDHVSIYSKCKYIPRAYYIIPII